MPIDSASVEQNARLGALAHRIGFAVLQVQALESSSAKYLVLRSQVQRGMGVEEAKRILAKAEREPFGRTIGDMRSAGLLPEHLEKRFKALLRERNWLVHRSRPDNSSALESDNGTLTMMLRIDAIAEEARLLILEVLSLSENFLRDSGISQQAVDAAAARVMKKWESNEAI